MKILLLGATGMLGHTLLCDFPRREDLAVYATARSREGLSRWFPPEMVAGIHTPVNADNFDTVPQVLAEIPPEVVINCIGVIKQLAAAKDPIAWPMNVPGSVRV